MENLAFVASHDSRDVVLDDLSQSVTVCDVFDPLWKLGMPDESVTSDFLVVGFGEVHEGVGAGEGELVAGGCLVWDVREFMGLNGEKRMGRKEGDVRSVASHFMEFSAVS